MTTRTKSRLDYTEEGRALGDEKHEDRDDRGSILSLRGGGARRPGQPTPGMPELPGEDSLALPSGEQQFKLLVISIFEELRELRARISGPSLAVMHRLVGS